MSKVLVGNVNDGLWEEIDKINTSLTDINSNLSVFMKLVTHTASASKTLNANGTESFSFNVIESGYTPIGIAFFDTDSPYVVQYKTLKSGNTITVTYRSYNSNNTVTITPSITVLYVKAV